MYPFNPDSLILLALKYFEMFPIHSGCGFIVEVFDFN